MLANDNTRYDMHFALIENVDRRQD